MLVDALQGHSIWSAVYDEMPNPLLQLERRVVGPWLGSLRSKKVADIACGTGRWAGYVTERGAIAIGADFCAPMLQRARHLRRANFGGVQADVLHLPFRDAVTDLTICAFAAGYVESPGKLTAELARITRPGGAIILTDIHPHALASGWRRSFRLRDEVYEIGHWAHAIEDYRAPGLMVRRREEISFGQPEREIFARCGREESFEALCAVPAIFALHWNRV